MCMLAGRLPREPYSTSESRRCLFWIKYSLRFRLRDMFSVTETPNPDCASVDPQAVQEHHDDPTTRPTTIQETTSTVRRLSPTEYWRDSRLSRQGGQALEIAIGLCMGTWPHGTALFALN